jgi:hypothetical protein
MRLLLKLSVAVALAVAMQYTSASVIGYLDELQFAARIYYADAAGIAPDSPELIDAADRLAERYRARMSPELPPLPILSPSYAGWTSRDQRLDGADSS